MNDTAREAIIARLERRVSDAPPARRHEDQVLHQALRRMVDAGATRLGMTQPDANGSQEPSACDLAPPLARMIDHTALKPETTEDDIRALCDEARRYCFASVCVNPSWIPLVAEELRGTEVGICTVVGFPFGATTTQAKAFETEEAVRSGCTEVDMVLHVGRLKSGDTAYVERDVRAVVEAAQGRRGGRKALVKVILETALLTDEEKVVACVLAQNADADFVKTSTGFSKHGAKPSDVALMRRVVGQGMGVKASGGVRSFEDAQTMIASGATRLGASASVAIVKGMPASGDGY